MWMQKELNELETMETSAEACKELSVMDFISWVTFLILWMSINDYFIYGICRVFLSTEGRSDALLPVWVLCSNDMITVFSNMHLLGPHFDHLLCLLPFTSTPGPENPTWHRWFQRVRSSHSRRWWTSKGSSDIS